MQGSYLYGLAYQCPSHKSYFQVQWTLSSAKLIPHDMPLGSDVERHLGSHAGSMRLLIFFLKKWKKRIDVHICCYTFLQSLKKFSRNTFFVVYSWSNIWAKNTATSSAARLSFTFFPGATKEKEKKKRKEKQIQHLKTWSSWYFRHFGHQMIEMFSSSRVILRSFHLKVKFSLKTTHLQQLVKNLSTFSHL